MKNLPGLNIVFTKAVLIFLLSGLQFGQHVSAQGTADERWFQVELIAFKRQPQEQQEQWPTSIKLNYPNNWVELKETAEIPDQTPDALTPDEPTLDELTRVEPNSAVSSTPNSAHQAFILLSENEQSLARHATALRRDSRFEVLFHEAWRQPITTLRNAPAILIKGGAKFDGHTELEGSITLSLTRLLQINTDLWLTQFALNDGQSVDWPTLPQAPGGLQSEILAQALTDNPDATDDFADAPAQFTEDTLLMALADEFVPTRIVQLQEERKMRSKELHYIDHPLFGLIILITPFDPSITTP